MGHRFFAEVAAFGNGPFVVLLQEDCTDEADYRGMPGKDPEHVRSALDLLVDPLQRVPRGDLEAPTCMWGAGWFVVSGRSSVGLAREAPAALLGWLSRGLPSDR